MINISLPDGSVRKFDRPVNGAEIAASIGPGLAKAALALRVDGKISLDDVRSLVRVTATFEPDPDARATYEPMYAEFKGLYGRLHGMYARLNARQD